MPRRRRTLMLAMLALAAPLPAFALSGEVDTTTEPAVTDLAVSASLDSCGLLEAQIVCQLSVSYATLPNATSYTASVTSPDGSVTDFGTVPAGGTSLTIPYAGNGNYGVRVTAYGTPEEPGGEEKVIVSDSSRDLSQGGADEPRISETPVEPEATTRNLPNPDATTRNSPVETEANCTQEPPVPPASEPDPATQPDQTTPDPAAPTTPVDPAAAEAEAGRASAETAVEQQAVDPATAPETPAAPAASDCPAP